MTFSQRFFCAVFLVLMVVVFCSSPHVVSAQVQAPKLQNIIPVRVHTMPLALKRIFRPDLNISESINGLYVENVKESSIFYKNGLRPGMVIRRLNDRKIISRKKLIEELSDSLNSTIEMKILNTHSEERSVLRFRYQLDRQKVVSYKKGPLYHDPSLEHSPDTNTKTYRSPYIAKVYGNRPCPVCYPGDKSSIWDEVISRGIGPTNPFVKNKVSEFGKVEPKPDFISSEFRKMSRYRLRYQTKPSLVILDTRRLFASGTPDGYVVLSRGILSYAEGLNQKRLLLAHMFAHMDARHPPRSVRQQQAVNILKRGINRVSDVSVGIDDFGDFLFEALGFTAQRRWQGLGYDEEYEREAQFLKYYYLRKMGVPLNIDRYWEVKRRDLVRNLHENWANYLVLHPTIDISAEKRRWKKEIIQHYQPGK